MMVAGWIMPVASYRDIQRVVCVQDIDVVHWIEIRRTHSVRDSDVPPPLELWMSNWMLLVRVREDRALLFTDFADTAFISIASLMFEATRKVMPMSRVRLHSIDSTSTRLSAVC